MDPKKHDLALSYALGELDERAMFAVEAQAERDPELRHEIRALEDGIAASVRTLPQHDAPADGYRTVQRRIDGLFAADKFAERPVHAMRWVMLGGLAALLIAGVSIGGYEWLRERREPRIFVAELSAGRTEIRPLALTGPIENRDDRFMQLASLAERLWETPEQATRGGVSGDGYAVFDPATNQGFIAIRALPALRTRQQYHLWFVDHETGRLRDAGALPLDRATRGMFFFSLPPEHRGRSAEPNFFLTIEDGMATLPENAPRGRVVLGERI